MQQADIRYIRTIYDNQQGLSQEHELSSTSAALLRNNDSRSARGGQSRDLQGKVLVSGRWSYNFDVVEIMFFICNTGSMFRGWSLLPWQQQQ